MHVAVGDRQPHGVLAALGLDGRVPVADRRHGRADISGIDSPPGNRAPEGWVCTVRQSFSLASFLSSWPVQSP